VVSRANREAESAVSHGEILPTLYMPFDHLLFFGDYGGGDQFAFPIHADGEIHKLDIFRWDHETDARSWYAGGLEQFFEHRFAREK
jgi:hypothetical protein